MVHAVPLPNDIICHRDDVAVAFILVSVMFFFHGWIYLDGEAFDIGLSIFIWVVASLALIRLIYRVATFRLDRHRAGRIITLAGERAAYFPSASAAIAACHHYGGTVLESVHSWEIPSVGAYWIADNPDDIALARLTQ